LSISCTKCGRVLPEESFPKDDAKKNGRKSHCRECCATAKREWRLRKIAENPNIEKEEYHKNRERRLEITKKYRETHREEMVQRTKVWRAENKEAISERRSRWWHEEGGKNIDKIKRFLYGYSGISSTGKRRMFRGYLRTQGICIVCGNDDPLVLQNSHIFPDNQEELISLCCNCHWLLDKYGIFNLKFPEDGWEEIDLNSHDDDDCEI
jgi:hypothetical protein